MSNDPEVEALLNDLPPPRLPQILVDEGWGQTSMRRSLRFGGRLVRPSEVVAPTFDERCVQCGRPLVKRDGYLRDHAGRSDCDRALIPEDLHDFVSTLHVAEGRFETTSEYIDNMRGWRELRRLTAEKPRPRIRVQPISKVLVQCQAKRTHGGHEHRCRHATDHFGFHECNDDDCRHLWH